jgi:Coenzyme PQQ synthesis protein D (PqqD)
MMSGRYFKHQKAFSQSAIDDEVVLLNLVDGTFFSLTGTAAEIWPLIDGTRTRARLLEELAITHGVGPTEIAADLDAFLAQLVDAGFIGIA